MAKAIDPGWAWAAYQPSDASPWDIRKVGHLYRRAAFGATYDELQVGVKDGLEKTIDRLLNAGPESVYYKGLNEKKFRNDIVESSSGTQARSWWLARILHSPHPLREKMTIFWHNHFATSFTKVQNVRYMIGQYDLMYRHALGNFRPLLQEMSKDPAMMFWLDTIGSKKGEPNENYARELMELFSLGIGNYSEKDIREAARAFTGWELRDNKPFFNIAQHDAGEKTVFGKQAAYRGEDIVNLCLEQKSCPYFICRKLYRFLVSETVEPTNELLAPLAEQFRKSDFDFGALVATVLRSNLFYSPEVYRSRIKGPVVFAIGIVRGLEGFNPEPGNENSHGIGTNITGPKLEELGQNVFHPPSVKGWDGGQVWLNGQTLLTRQNLALSLCEYDVGYKGKRRAMPAVLAEKHGKKTDAELIDLFMTVFLQNDAPPGARERLTEYQQKSQKQKVPVYWTPEDFADSRVRSLCHLVLTMPEFQLD